jgi:translocation and assembly module TamB
VIRGVVDLDRVYYLTDLKLGPAQLLRRLLQKQRLEIVETDEFLASTQLNVTVRAPGAVRVRNNVANLHGSADLALRGTLAAPVVFGRVEVDAGGSVRYGDNDYEIDRAVVNFTNPYRIEPVFDIVARTTVDAYKVKLTLSGTVDRLKPVFSSDPPIPENEVLGLLATGQASTSTASSQNDLSQGVGAEAFLYGQAASLVGQRVGNLFGLDSFRVEPLTGASSTLSSVRVTVGKRLRRNLYVTYSVDPSGTQEQIFKVEWQVRPELALILTQNGDGSYALDARWEKSY